MGGGSPGRRSPSVGGICSVPGRELPIENALAFVALIVIAGIVVALVALILTGPD